MDEYFGIYKDRKEPIPKSKLGDAQNVSAPTERSKN